MYIWDTMHSTLHLAAKRNRLQILQNLMIILLTILELATCINRSLSSATLFCLSLNSISSINRQLVVIWQHVLCSCGGVLA